MIVKVYAAPLVKDCDKIGVLFNQLTIGKNLDITLDVSSLSSPKTKHHLSDLKCGWSIIRQTSTKRLSLDRLPTYSMKLDMPN